MSSVLNLLKTIFHKHSEPLPIDSYNSPVRYLPEASPSKPHLPNIISSIHVPTKICQNSLVPDDYGEISSSFQSVSNVCRETQPSNPSHSSPKSQWSCPENSSVHQTSTFGPQFKECSPPNSSNNLCSGTFDSSECSVINQNSKSSLQYSSPSYNQSSIYRCFDDLESSKVSISHSNVIPDKFPCDREPINSECSIINNASSGFSPNWVQESPVMDSNNPSEVSDVKASSLHHRITKKFPLDLRGGGRSTQFEDIITCPPNQSHSLHQHEVCSSSSDASSYLCDFQKQLGPSGFYILEMKKDGNCLFRSVADQLLNNQEEHGKYRKFAVDFISDHIIRYQNFMTFDPGKNFKDYLSTMSLDGSWGSHLEIQALSEALNLKVIIHIKDKDSIIIGPNSSEESKEIHLAFHPTQEHYDSVRCTDELSDSCPLILTKSGTLDKRSRAFKLISSRQNLKRKAENPLEVGELKKCKLSTSLTEPKPPLIPAIHDSDPQSALPTKPSSSHPCFFPFGFSKPPPMTDDYNSKLPLNCSQSMQHQVSLNLPQVNDKISSDSHSSSEDSEDLTWRETVFNLKKKLSRTEIHFQKELSILQEENKRLKSQIAEFEVLKPLLKNLINFLDTKDPFVLPPPIHTIPDPKSMNAFFNEALSSLDTLNKRMTNLEIQNSRFTSETNSKLSEILMDNLSNKVARLGLHEDQAKVEITVPSFQSGTPGQDRMELEPECSHAKKSGNYYDSNPNHSSGELMETYITAPNSPSISSQPVSPTRSQKLAIPWKGKILRPSYQQLRDYHGNLNHILSDLGGDTPSESEKSFNSIRIPWKNQILWPSPYQLLTSEGDLNRLMTLIKNPTRSIRNSFRKIFKPKTIGGYVNSNRASC